MEAIDKLLGEKKTLMDTKLKGIFEEGGMEIGETSNKGNIVAEDETIHLSSNKFNTVKGKIISEIETSWAELNIDFIKQTKEEDLPNLKVSCVRCVRQEFDTLEASPVYEDYREATFIKKERISKTKEKLDRKIREIISYDFLFTCPVCGAGITINLEVEDL